MSNTLTFYSIAKVQVDRLLEHLGLTPDEEGMVSGETPLGKLTCQVAYVESSGQLSVTVIDKPHLLTFATIETHIKSAMTAAEAVPVEAPLEIDPLGTGRQVRQVAGTRVDPATGQVIVQDDGTVIEPDGEVIEPAEVFPLPPTSTVTGTPAKRVVGRTVVSAPPKSSV
jgi:hypothetical protein